MVKINTFRNIFKYPPIHLNREEQIAYKSKYFYPETFQMVEQSTLLGIEVEVENVNNAIPLPPFWSVTDDGSLRNHGHEYISIPTRAVNIEYSLRMLYEYLRKNFTYDFSPRCSIHVHCNIRTMTPENLTGMMMIYLIAERLLFKFVGQDRDKNIHCVPLLDTSIIQNLAEIVNGVRGPADGWMKYSAVNLLPLIDKGTVEFRQMHGTDDVEKLLTWINLILCMKKYSYRNNVEGLIKEIFSLNSNSEYRQFLVNVFGSYADMLLSNISYKEYASFMEEGVTQAKLLFGSIHNLDIYKSNADKGTLMYKKLYGDMEKMVTKSRLKELLTVPTGAGNIDWDFLNNAVAGGGGGLNPTTPPMPHILKPFGS